MWWWVIGIYLTVATATILLLGWMAKNAPYLDDDEDNTHPPKK